ncbi:MAG: pilus assembly protein N-terminal domain-containing protein [Gemmatales bacterium]
MNQHKHSTLVHGRWSLWTCSVLCLAVVTVTLPALADEPVVKPAGTRIVQPLVVQASYSEAAPAVKQDDSKNKQDKTPGKTASPVVTPVKTPQTGQGTGNALPEPPKFPNLDNKLPAVPPKTEPQEKAKPQPQDIFAPRARMNAIDAPIGSTPKPDQKTLDKYRTYVESIDDPDNTLELVVGRPRILQLKQAPVKFQAVDPNIADIEVIKESKDKAFFVLGKQPGTTVIALFFSDPNSPDKFKVLNYLVRVVPDPETKSRIERVYKALEDEINRAFPDSVVRLCLVGDKLVVSGQAKDAAAASKIIQVIREQAPQQTPANRLPVDRIDLTVTPDPLNPDQTIAQGLQNFVVSGNANIINLLRVPGEQQVMLRVQVAEVSRSAMRSIGMDFNVLKGGTLVRQNTGGLLGTGTGLNAGAFGASANVGAVLDNGSIILALNALRTMGYSRTLAEPTLVTLNGQAATFQAGGEFPVPVVVGNASGGLQGINYKPFGVSLNFTPIVFDKDRIRLTINAEVSGINQQAGTNGGGLGGNANYSVPNQIDSRRFTNVVELREGQTLAVAGLISNGVNANSKRIPLFGDIPFFGRAFGLDQVNSAEQELIFIITPELVHPMECSEVPPLPGYNVFEPGDTEFYLFSRLESRRSEDYRAGARTDIHRMLNYKQGKDAYISGPFGSSSGPAGINPGPNNVVIPTQPLPVLPPPQSTGPNPPR